MKKNVASQAIGCQMVAASDGSAFTGSVTVSVTGDAGTQATGSVGSGACTHEGNGYHTYAPAQAETNYDLVAFTFTGTGAIPATVQIYTSFPQTGDNFARIGAPAGASVSADIAAMKVDTAAILVDTGTTLDGRIPAALVSGRMDASVGAMAANVMTAAAAAADLTTELQSGLATSAALATAQTSIDDLPTNAELATALGTADDAILTAIAALNNASVAAIADGVWDEAKAGHLTAGTYGQHFGAATESATVNDAGATTTAFITTLASAVNDHYVGRVIIFTSGTLLNQATTITDYVGATKTVTVVALTSAPANSVSFIVV